MPHPRNTPDLRRTPRALAFGAALCALLVCARPAFAQSDKALAESLFEAGRELMAQGRFEEACAKFRDSQRIDASSGTSLNLADCLAKGGKTASAWAEFLEASRLAEAQSRPDRVAEAERRAAELEAKLSYLTVVVEDPVEDQRVLRGDVELNPAAWNTRVAVDPGVHELRAEAPGHQGFRAEVHVGAGRNEITTRIPPLQPLPMSQDSLEVEANPTGSDAAPARPDHRALGYSLLGGGAALLAGGIAAGFAGKAAYAAAEQTCGGSVAECPASAIAEAADDRDRADTLAWVGNALGAVGIAAAVTGSILLIVGLRRDREARALRMDAAPLAGGGHLTFTGTF